MFIYKIHSGIATELLLNPQKINRKFVNGFKYIFIWSCACISTHILCIFFIIMLYFVIIFFAVKSNVKTTTEQTLVAARAIFITEQK